MLVVGEPVFDGVVVTDWNAVDEVQACSKESCAQSINAGIDMIMVPEDWKKFLENTVIQVRVGDIPQSRIDDAVTRILRVKLRESERWQAAGTHGARATPAQLFAPALRRATLSGVFVAVTAVLTWWACNAFIPLLGSRIANLQLLQGDLATHPLWAVLQYLREVSKTGHLRVRGAAGSGMPKRLGCTSSPAAQGAKRSRLSCPISGSRNCWPRPARGGIARFSGSSPSQAQ